MAKGVFRGQAEPHPRDPALPNTLVSTASMTSFVKGICRDEYEMPQQPQMGASRYEDNENLSSSFGRAHFDEGDSRHSSRNTTQNVTRATSPSNEGRTSKQDKHDLSDVLDKSFKIVLDNGASTTEAAKPPKPHPQEAMDKFWNNFEPDFLGKVTRILPTTLIENTPACSRSAGETASEAVSSYEQARDRCIRDVKRIIRECRSFNRKYTDTHFDIERDLKITGRRDCLDDLVMAGKDKYYPSDVKRVSDIFEKPTFLADSASFDDIIQGSLGDCWLLAAFSILMCNKDLVRKVCVIHDADAGVYGFVFYRDGEWHQCIIDDKLYLKAPSFDESGDVVLGMYGVQQQDEEQCYTNLYSKGSKSLYFGKCRDENETWVPLLEKALAKAHGSYQTLKGGQTGEAIEDLTGGVTTEIYTTNILNKDEFWYNELKRIGKDFVFSAAAAAYQEWRPGGSVTLRKERRQGVISSHAYAVLDTYEGHGVRLVKMRNPWGCSEWRGAWSDGSKEWNAEWFERLNHKFGDDGVFWISYEDMLSNYKYIDRTRIFTSEWHVAQQWTSVQVPWNPTTYQQTYFSIDVPEKTDAVIVLSQLDDRYFRGLQGVYNYTLQFRVQNDNDDEEEYIARSARNIELVRSINVEIPLEKGKYSILFKVEATKTSRQDVETVIRDNIWRKEKLMQVGTLYDLAHQKGQSKVKPTVVDTDDTKSVASVTSGVTNKETNEEDPNRDPWNAFCVVGIRVYSKQPDLGLKVIMPEEESTTTVLDRDDIAKAALVEAQANSEAVPEVPKPVGSASETTPTEVSQIEKPATNSTEPTDNTKAPVPSVPIESVEVPDTDDTVSSTVEIDRPDLEVMSIASTSNADMDDLAGDKAEPRASFQKISSRPSSAFRHR